MRFQLQLREISQKSTNGQLISEALKLSFTGHEVLNFM